MSDALKRYHAAAHAMQSGVAMEMNYNDAPTQPKHLRVGVNVAMVDHAALMTLLIEKGIVTREECEEALASAMEKEKKRYEEHLTGLLGIPVTLE